LDNVCTLSAGLGLTLANERAELDRLMQWLVAAFKANAVGETTWSAVQICIDEAFANILEHGVGDGRARAVEIRLRSDGDTLLVDIIDDGAAFDPTAVAPPEQASRLEDARIGGLGIHFIRHMARSMSYAREAERNHLRLTFPLVLAPTA
jgi:serine/threonine-protein kinase RsbW